MASRVACRTVEIPIHDKDEVIEIELEKLPPAAEALEILKDVRARLHVWHTLDAWKQDD